MTQSSNAGRLSGLAEQCLSILSHDARTPLTAIRGAAGLLQGELGDSLNEQQARLMDIVRRNADLASQMLQDIVDLLRIQCADETPVHIEFGVLQEAADVWENMRSSSALHVELEESSEGLALLSDRHMFRSAVSALLRLPQGEPAESAWARIGFTGVSDGLDIICTVHPCGQDRLTRLMEGPVRSVRLIEEMWPTTGLEWVLLQEIGNRLGFKPVAESVEDDGNARFRILWPGSGDAQSSVG